MAVKTTQSGAAPAAPSEAAPTADQVADEFANQAVPLDALLVDAALAPAGS